MYPHTLNLLEQETGTTGVLTPRCPFDDDDDDDDDNDHDVGESRKKGHWQSRSPLAHFHLPQTDKPTENLFYLCMQNY